MSYRLIYICIGFASFLTVVFHMFNQQPQFVKILTGGLQFLSVIFLSFNLHKLHNKTLRVFLRLILLYVLIQITRCLLFPTEIAFTTFIFSPYNVFWCSLPLFILLTNDNSFIRKYLKLSIVCCLLSIFVLRAIGLGVFILCVFSPYFKKRKASLLITTIAIGVDVAYGLGVLGIESARTYLLEIVVMLWAGFAIWILQSKKLAKWSAIFLLAFPIILVLSIFTFEDSILKMVNEYGGANNEVIGSDTRTFLYVEIIQNMNSLSDWLFGLGYNARYFSEFFLNSTSENADFYMRTNVEVGFLQLLLKGGIILVFMHYYLLIRAVYTGIKNSSNLLCNGCALFIAGYILLSFIVDYPSRNPIVQILPWICAGICFSKNMLSKSDKEINALIKS